MVPILRCTRSPTDLVPVEYDPYHRSRERRGIDRDLQRLRKCRQPTDVVKVGMGDQDTVQVLDVLLEKRNVR